MDIAIYDCLQMDHKERESIVQIPVYSLFSKIYKGPRYENQNFCFKKFVKDGENNIVVKAQLCYNENKQLVGATSLKVHQYFYKGQRILKFEGTSGFDESFRGKGMIAIFQFNVAKDLEQEFPDAKIVFSDLLTSAISYTLLIGKISHAHPRFDAAMK